MRILANYGYKTNGDSFSVTFETMGDVPAEKAPSTVDELFRLAKDAVQRQIGGRVTAAPPVEDPVQVPRPVLSRAEGPVARTHANGNGNGRKPVIKDPSQPASPKQLQLIRGLAKQKGLWLEGLEDLTKGEASVKIDELMALAA